MSFEFADNITSIVLNAVMTLALAGLLLLLGYYVRKKIPALAKYCIPAPVIGGFIFMFVTFAGHVTGTFQVKFTNIFQDYFMLAFFTTVGLGASLKLLKKGGLLLIGQGDGLIGQRDMGVQIALSIHLNVRDPHSKKLA